VTTNVTPNFTGTNEVITFRVRDKDHPDYKPRKAIYRDVKREGRWFVVEGEQLELFQLKVLCQALDRTRETILQWEKDELFPKSMFRVPGSRIIRWYSGVQIINLHNLLHYKYGNTKSLHFQKTAFLQDVQEVFYEREVTQEGNGKFILAKNLRQAKGH